MRKWFAASNLVLNLDKTKMIEFVTNNSPQSAFGIGHKENLYRRNSKQNIPCFTNNNQVMWRNLNDQSKEMLSRSWACHAVRSIFNISDTHLFVYK